MNDNNNKQAADNWVCADCGAVYLNHRMAAFTRTHCQYCGKQSVPIPRSTRDAIRKEGIRIAIVWLKDMSNSDNLVPLVDAMSEKGVLDDARKFIEAIKAEGAREERETKAQRMQRPERLAELCEGPAWDYIQALERQVWYDIVRKRHPQQSIIDRLPTDANGQTVVPGDRVRWNDAEYPWLVESINAGKHIELNYMDGKGAVSGVVVPADACTLVKESEADDGKN